MFPSSVEETTLAEFSPSMLRSSSIPPVVALAAKLRSPQSALAWETSMVIPPVVQEALT